jgi:hypothetical protein
MTPQTLELSATVFADETQIALVFEGDTRTAAVAVERGLAYCGLFYVSGGEVEIECEPGKIAVSAMLSAGPEFAAALGEKLKQYQLAKRG